MVTADIETARNDHQVSNAEAPKSRSATWSKAAAITASASPNSTYNDLETLLPVAILLLLPTRPGPRTGSWSLACYPNFQQRG